MHDPREHDRSTPLAGWMRDALRAPIDSSLAQREAIMARVRRVGMLRRLAPPMRASRWSRRGLLNPMSGMAMVAMLVVAISVRTVESTRSVRSLEATSLVLGDSVVPVAGANTPVHDAAHEAARDASSDPIGARLLDTLRIVEFVLRGRDVRSVAVVGDFNAWQRGATTLQHAGTDRWRARVLVPRDALRFAFVVNESQWVTAPPLHKATTGSHSLPDSI